MNSTYFITAIDTGVGKTVVTGMLARWLNERGVSVITQKLAQTGCEGISEDIIEHRRYMGVPIASVDIDNTTCPYVFPFPATPALSAKMVNKTIDLATIERSTQKLCNRYEKVLLEGVGGLMVPLTDEYMVIDYIAEHKLPTILITSGKLGSINHTFLSLEALHQRGIHLSALIYNQSVETPAEIEEDSLRRFARKLSQLYPEAPFLKVPVWNPSVSLPDFSFLLD